MIVSKNSQVMVVDCNGVGAPIISPTRRFEVLDIKELYTDPTGSGQMIPNVRDLVVDYENNCFWRCSDVDYTKFKYTLVKFDPAPIYNADAEIGGCAQSQAETFRVLIDPSKHPMTLRVDGRLKFIGSDCDRIRIFKGMNISLNAIPISAYFQAGVYISNSIPMQLAAIDQVDNKTIKEPVPGHCNVEVEDGELLTIVAYSDTDDVVAIARAYAINTNMVLATETPSRQIQRVELISPFISPSDDRLLSIPINMPIDDLPLQCKVTYNDGVVVIPVDGMRAKLTGLRNSGSHDTFFISSTVGQKLDLQLTYFMANSESYIGNNVVDGAINEEYRAITEMVDGAYSVKLFVVPEWLDNDRGYRLRYFLYNLERGNVFEATAHVLPSLNSPAFDPRLYGVKQRLVVRCELDKVSPIYLPHIHSQTFYISLLRPGTDTADSYMLEYQQGKPDYGEAVYARFDYDNVQYWSLDVASGCKSKSEWLEKMYRLVYPLYDTRSEVEAPEPTHFVVVVNNQEFVRTVDQWLEPFNVDFRIDQADLVMIKWLRRLPNAELQLGISPMLAYQDDPILVK